MNPPTLYGVQWPGHQPSQLLVFLRGWRWASIVITILDPVQLWGELFAQDHRSRHTQLFPLVFQFGPRIS